MGFFTHNSTLAIQHLATKTTIMHLTKLRVLVTKLLISTFTESCIVHSVWHCRINSSFVHGRVWDISYMIMIETQSAQHEYLTS